MRSRLNLSHGERASSVIRYIATHASSSLCLYNLTRNLGEIWVRAAASKSGIIGIGKDSGRLTHYPV